MKKFLYLYFGGNPPKSPEEGKAMMDNWMAYFGKMGDRIADGGAPIGPQKSVGKHPDTRVAGYSRGNGASHCSVADQQGAQHHATAFSSARLGGPA